MSAEGLQNNTIHPADFMRMYKKRKATATAQLAMKGHVVHDGPNGDFLVARWGLSKYCQDLAALDADGNWQLKPGLAISASPASVLGANHTGTQPGPDPTVHVHSYSSADVLAHCQLLGVEDALAHGVDELDNYWLSIRDSRDDSLLDLAARLETALGPGVMLSGLSIDEWTDACVSWSDVVPVRPATVGETKTVLELWKGRV